MAHSLRHKTLSALLWGFLDRFGQQSIQFVVSIILARLLLPEEFGLIAMLTIFMAVAGSFIDSGFGQALIQKQDADHVDECSIFYFNIFISSIAAILLCFAAPWIANFYDQPLLVLLTRAMSLNLVINAFGQVHRVLLTKALDFKTQLKISVITTVASGGVGISMAVYGFGVWSLVAQSLCGSFMGVFLLWFYNSWRPKLLFSGTALKGMFRFGSKLLASGLLDTVFQNLYLIVIGKVFSAADLGFYSRARNLQQLPVRSISSVVERVTFPVFASVQEDKQRLKRGVQKALSMMMFVCAPMMVGMAVTAESLVLVLLTDKWLSCVPYLQLFCVIGLLYPAHVINLNVLKAQGRSELFLKLEIIKKTLVALTIFLTYQHGILAMLYGQICVSLISYMINAYYTKTFINYSFIEQIKDFAPQILFSSVMAVFVHYVTYINFTHTWLLLFSQIVVGMFVYIFLSWLFNVPSFNECVGMLHNQREKDSARV